MHARVANSALLERGHVTDTERLTSPWHQRTKERARRSDAVEATLNDITEGRYISPRKLDQLLRSLPGVNASLPATEITRLESLLPRALSPETTRNIELLRDKTEGNIPALCCGRARYWRFFSHFIAIG